MVNVLQELACLPYQKNTTRANLEKSHDEKQEPEESNMEGQEPLYITFCGRFRNAQRLSLT